MPLIKTSLLLYVKPKTKTGHKLRRAGKFYFVLDSQTTNKKQERGRNPKND